MRPFKAGKPGTTVESGSTTVATAQTPVQLTTTVLKGTCIGVWISADPGNVGKNAAVGSSTVNAKAKSFKGVALREFVAIFIEIDDPSKLWVDVETSGDKISWLAVLA